MKEEGGRESERKTQQVCMRGRNQKGGRERRGSNILVQRFTTAEKAAACKKEVKKTAALVSLRAVLFSRCSLFAFAPEQRCTHTHTLGSSNQPLGACRLATGSPHRKTDAQLSETKTAAVADGDC